MAAKSIRRTVRLAKFDVDRPVDATFATAQRARLHRQAGWQGEDVHHRHCRLMTNLYRLPACMNTYRSDMQEKLRDLKGACLAGRSGAFKGRDDVHGFSLRDHDGKIQELFDQLDQALTEASIRAEVGQRRALQLQIAAAEDMTLQRLLLQCEMNALCSSE